MKQLRLPKIFQGAKPWLCSSLTILLLKKCQDKSKSFQDIGLTGMRLKNLTSQFIIPFFKYSSEYNPEAGDCKELQFSANKKNKLGGSQTFCHCINLSNTPFHP